MEELCLKLSKNQIETIKRALDLYSRVLCGQLEEVPRCIQRSDLTKNNIQLTNFGIDRAIHTLKRLLFKDVYPGSYGICSKEKLPQKAAIAYDIFQAIEALQAIHTKTFKTSIETFPVGSLVKCNQS